MYKPEAHGFSIAKPLHHGVLRYIHDEESANSPLDRRFILVPRGFIQQQQEQQHYFSKIISALDLEMPNFCIVSAEASGNPSDQSLIPDSNEGNIGNKTDNRRLHETAILQSKIDEILQSIVRNCVDTGAWLLPQSPRRRNGAAQLLCKCLPVYASSSSSPNNTNANSTQPIVLGTIGLDQRDEQDGLAGAIRDHAVPMGSPVETVVQITMEDSNTGLCWSSKGQVDSDTSRLIEDGAPLPQLTHVLIFESPAEEEIFREELLGRVPDVYLALGQLTQASINGVYEAVVSGSPIVLLEHTSIVCNQLMAMFRHIKKIYATQKNLVEGNNRPDFSSNKGLYPMPDMANESIQLFLRTWPESFDPNTIVLANPLQLTAAVFQKRMIRAVTAAFDLKQGPVEVQEAKKAVLDYAWSFQNLTADHRERKKWQAYVLYVQLAGFTLLSIVASVAYDRMYGEKGGHPSGEYPLQLCIFVATIFLPLYVTALKKETDQKDNPSMRRAALGLAAARLESEIFQYRAQVGPYRPQEKTSRALRAPVEALTKKTRQIWSQLHPFLTDDNLQVPENFWEPGAPLPEWIKTKGINMTEDTFVKPESYSGSKQGALAGRANYTTDIESRGVFLSSETTPMISSGELPSYNHAIAEGEGTTNGIKDKKEDDDDSVDSQAEKVDDNYSPLTADDYINIRMKERMNVKSEEVERMVYRNQGTTGVIRLVTMLSGATAALSLQWTVPIILGVSAALTTAQEFSGYGRRIEAANSMIVQLNELKLWWMSLSPYQKQLPHNKDRLIRIAETSIIAEVSQSLNAPLPAADD